MRALKSILLVLIALVLVSGPAHADMHTGNHLYLDCTRGHPKLDPDMQELRCLSFISGFITLQGTLERLEHRPEFCIPDDTMLKQYQLFFIYWAGRNANVLHQPAGSVLLDAMKEAFPCPAG